MIKDGNAVTAETSQGPSLAECVVGEGKDRAGLEGGDKAGGGLVERTTQLLPVGKAMGVQ